MPKIMVFYVLRYSIASLTASGSTNNQQASVLGCQRHVGSQRRRQPLRATTAPSYGVRGACSSKTIDRLRAPYARRCPTQTKSLFKNNAMLYYCVSGRLSRNCRAISHGHSRTRQHGSTNVFRKSRTPRLNAFPVPNAMRGALPTGLANAWTSLFTTASYYGRHTCTSHSADWLFGRGQDDAAQSYPEREARSAYCRDRKRVRRDWHRRCARDQCGRRSVRDEQWLHLLHGARRFDSNLGQLDASPRPVRSYPG